MVCKDRTTKTPAQLQLKIKHWFLAITIIFSQITLFAQGDTKITGQKIRWERKEVKQNNRSGRRLELVFTGSDKLIPAYYFAFTLLDQDSYIVMQVGIRNTLPHLCRFMKAETFEKYTLSMWQRLRKDGMVGIKFDYPETAWDNNSFEPQYVTTGGLRWYKAGSVFRYYPDSKAIHIHSREIRQSLLTMMAFTSGRLELATPFNMLTPEMVHDISRIYPVYDGINSPRPIDAFTQKKDPTIYDLALTGDWHQLALFNANKEKSTISVGLSAPLIDGGLAHFTRVDGYQRIEMG